MANSVTKNTSSFNKTDHKSKYDKVVGYSPERRKGCHKHAKDVYETNEEKYRERGQDNPNIIIPQTRNGKLLEFHTRDLFVPDYPSITMVDVEIYPVGKKSWSPDLMDATVPFSLAIKAKDAYDAEIWTPSWIFGTDDRKIFPKQGGDIDQHQYACMGIVDDASRECYLLCCVNVLWLHHWGLFAPPDRDTVRDKVTVRYDYAESGVKKKFTKNGVQYSSIMDIVREEYDGDESILWQL